MKNIALLCTLFNQERERHGIHDKGYPRLETTGNPQNGGEIM